MLCTAFGYKAVREMIPLFSANIEADLEGKTSMLLQSALLHNMVLLRQ